MIGYLSSFKTSVTIKRRILLRWPERDVFYYAAAASPDEGGWEATCLGPGDGGVRTKCHRTKCHQQWKLFLFSSKFLQNFIQNTKHQHTFYRNKSQTA